MPRPVAQITIQMMQPDDPKAPPQVLVSHPPDDQLCGMLLWTASKLIAKNLAELHDEQTKRVELARELPGFNGTSIR